EGEPFYYRPGVCFLPVEQPDVSFQHTFKHHRRSRDSGCNFQLNRRQRVGSDRTR
ncbi:hypothetical protein E3U43_019218, partial [Larimichthys crocea]